jgi:diacylglycerol O-acyltransferase / wax synthase
MMPPLYIYDHPHDPESLHDLICQEVSATIDPLNGVGWRIAAAPDGNGGTMVVNWASHAFGDARNMLENVFCAAGSQSQPEVKIELNAPPSRGAVNELGDIVSRVRQGLNGTVRLGREALVAPWSQGSKPELVRVSPTIAAYRRRKRQVGALSSKRTVAMVRVEHAAWKRAANAHGGSSNSLFLAVLASLLRGARIARGDHFNRDVRILLPVDIGDHIMSMPDAPAVRPENTVIASIVRVPGDDRHHGDLTEIRDATRDGIVAAIEELAATGGSTSPLGLVDAMKLLPAVITHRIGMRVQGDVDGVASNVGPIPREAGMIEGHDASETYLLAAPTRTDMTGCFGRLGSISTLSFMADPARLGPGGDLRTRVNEELETWGVAAEVW